MKVAVINDTHFGARNTNLHILENMRRFYREIFFPEIERRGIKTILHLGDLNDNRKSINQLVGAFMLEEFFDPIERLGITIHIIAGNHDTYYKSNNSVNALSMMLGNRYPNVHIYEKETIQLNISGVDILMCPWLSPDNKEKCLENIASSNAQILMGHFEIEGCEMDGGRLCEHGLNRALFRGFDQVYSGHFHCPSETDNITYLGAPYEMNWGDAGGRRGFHIFDSETREMEWIINPLSQFRIINYDDQGLTTEDLEELDTSTLAGTFIKVSVKHKTNPYLFDLFKTKIEDSDVADLKVIDLPKELETEESIDETRDTLDILEEFVDGVETFVNKSKLKSLLNELYKEALNK